MQTVNDIRTAFLNFFKDKGHEVVSSSPLVPKNDPTLLFTNAGMVQFKDVFTGKETRDYSRAATSQKCVRAGGKHNDLENVGYTARHHTFFEMLGNFSFGDYFKDDAIDFAWTLTHKEFGLPKDKLLVTVYSEDTEARDIWKKVAGLSDDRIISIPTSDNFWSMGDTGPCGPCSEIFYDHGDHIFGGPPGTPDEDGDRFVEIWNLVFMQYEQKSKDERISLPKPSIDTGMGLERIAAVLQGKHNNYDTDLFQSMIEHSTELTGQAGEECLASHRVIADHLRSACFLVADGVLPSNEGRGYVLRRIMRRGMRHAHLLGAKDPLMWQLVPTLIAKMGGAYDELKRAESLITETLRTEEEQFKQTLGRGLKLLEEETGKLSADAPLPGEVAFKLYDTYGFPLDLTQDVLRGQDRAVDTDGFDKSMEEQRARARAAWSGSGEQATDQVWFEIRDRLEATEFLGYQETEAEGVIQALVQGGAEVTEVTAGEEPVMIITNQTPFYGESGGQMGDAGVITTDTGAEVQITDTQKKLDMHIHIGTITKGSLKTEEVVHQVIDVERRAMVKANHSATHLLHGVLRKQLGDHVTQKGSLVAPDRLRFDFSHPKAMTAEEIESVEREVNELILENAAVETRLLRYDEALELGAMALFGEKYGDEVRVVSMCKPHEGSTKDCLGFSIEFCGGTHVSRTGDIGLFKITSEAAVSSGVRRLEAVTHRGALNYVLDQSKTLQTLAQNLKSSPKDITTRVKGLQAEKKKLEKQLKEARRGGGGTTDSTAEAKDVAGVKLSVQTFDDLPAKELKPIVDQMKQSLGSGVAVAISTNEGRPSIVVGVTQDLTDKHNAVELVQAGAVAMGGKGGGGRPDMAQSGGTEVSKVPEAITAIEQKMAG